MLSTSQAVTHEAAMPAHRTPAETGLFPVQSFRDGQTDVHVVRGSRCLSFGQGLP